MALLTPSMPAALRYDGGIYRELDLVQTLAAGLPAEYEIFHGMALHTVRDGHDYYGEIDIVVLAPSGALLLMEVKAGSVILRNGQIFKLYGDREHDVTRQYRLQRSSLLSRLQDARLDAGVISCLVLPDYHLEQAPAASVPSERIIDASRYGQMTTLVREWLSAGKGCAQLDALRRLLRNQFRVLTDLSAAREQLQRTTRVLSDGLATWVPRMRTPSGLMRIQATAGSGKTQLALRLLESAVAAGQAACYVCYNRPLADYMRARGPARATIINFHELAVDHSRRVAGEPDFDAPNALALAAARYVDDSTGFASAYDVLLIDEGQDFEPHWVECLWRLLRPDGRLYLMEDEDQRLYDRPDFEIADAVTVCSRDNFRSPRLVCDLINALRLGAQPINSLSNYRGEVPGFHLYADNAQLLAQIETAVRSLLERGFALADIVVLSNRGRAGSALTGVTQLGPWRTRQFLGRYDRCGEPLWSDGELLVESVYRYKGQSAPAVVLVELAFDALAPQQKKKLLVGLTRAQMAVEMVLTAQAEQVMQAAFLADH